MHEEKLYELICENSAAIDIMDRKQLYRFSTSYMAQQLRIPRNLASAALNKLYNTGALIKINTRPVYYLDRMELENRYHFNILHSLFFSVEQFYALLQQNDGEEDAFSQIISYDKSLKTQIEQCKAALYYPGTGLPVLISGPTGTGKSSLARYMHTFCIQKKLIGEDAPFITFNCADYADNPELLTGILFGYVKGSFTGADRDRVGLLEQANGGVLFLDEAHRLSSNGQEKLFVFIDQGIFNRLGESSAKRKSKVRLIFATTEHPKGTFLETFLRRIPVSIRMPALDEWDSEEVVHLICHLLSKEARTLGRELSVSQNFFKVLLNCRFTGNIGELHNAIQYACAKAFYVFCEQSDDEIYVRSSDLPEYLLSEANSPKDSRWGQWNLALERIRITANFRYENVRRLVEKQNTSLNVQTAYYNVFHSYLAAAEHHQEPQTVVASMENALSLYMDVLFQEQKDRGSNIHISILNSMINSIVDSLFYIRNITLIGNSRNLLTLHFFRRLNFLNMDNIMPAKLVEEIRSFFSREYPQVYTIAEELFSLFGTNLDIRLKYTDFIIMVLCIHWSLYKTKTYNTKALIVGHGYSTATSIASTVNSMLGNRIFEFFDLPPNITEEEAVRQVSSFLKGAENHEPGDLIILADMDNLVEQQLCTPEDFGGSIAVLGNITTQIALEVGRCVLQNLSVEEILDSILNKANLKYSLHIQQQTAHHQAIITTCVTGMGIAEKLANMLRDSLSQWLPDIKFIPYDYKSLRMNGLQESVFKVYTVSMILGTADPGVEGIPYVNVGDVMTTDNGKNKLQQALSAIVPPEYMQNVNDQLIKNFSLQRVLDYLTILNPEHVMANVEQFIRRLECGSRKRFDNSVKMLLYVHVSCMIERLIKKIPISGYETQSDFTKKQKKFINIVQESFSVIESVYSVNIPLEEIMCIYDIVTMKQNTSLIEQEL